MNKQELFELSQLRYDQFKDFLSDLGISTRTWKVRVKIGKLSEFPATRNVAYTAHLKPNKCEIVFAPKWNQLTPENYDAVLQHELCHVLHMIRPDIFNILIPYGFNYDEDQCEIFADQMAEVIFDNPIYYDKSLIQTLEPQRIRKRPRHLGW